MQRTHTCGALGIGDIGKEVILYGWVQRIRDKGKMVWIDVRDRYGVTQVVVEKGVSGEALFGQVRALGREYVVRVEGKVVERVHRNPKLATGGIEVVMKGLDVVNRSEVPPFIIEDESDGQEALRMKYRYLDLRRPVLQRNLLLKQRLGGLVRDYLVSRGFLEIETPILVRSTPEGARDFVVPSRKEKGLFYALPQSPQVLKQLLMVGGMDRYFQFARCFRDEDLRMDRQPEFTQLDCELSFVDQGEILSLFEGLVKRLFGEGKGIDLGDFPVMGYDEAMSRYGSDRPDIRFDMELVDLTKELGGVGCPLWSSDSTVMGIRVAQGSKLSRKVLDRLGDFILGGVWDVSRLGHIKYMEKGVRSPLDKWYEQQVLRRWCEVAHVGAGDLLLVLGGMKGDVQLALGALRLEVIKEMGLRPKCAYAPLWVVDFPLLSWDDEAGRYEAVHHPFTSPKDEDMGLLAVDPLAVRGNAYDMVINGVEIGGGSIRIHDRALQEKVFELLGIGKKEAMEHFGTLLSALSYGAPSHGGIALGWERLCLMIGGGSGIREYIAFPKNNALRDVMLGAPAPLFQH